MLSVTQPAVPWFWMGYQNLPYPVHRLGELASLLTQRWPLVGFNHGAQSLVQGWLCNPSAFVPWMWKRKSSLCLRAATDDWDKPWWLHWVSGSTHPEACLSLGFSLRRFTLNCLYGSLSCFSWYLQHNELSHKNHLRYKLPDGVDLLWM